MFWTSEAKPASLSGSLLYPWLPFLFLFPISMTLQYSHFSCSAETPTDTFQHCEHKFQSQLMSSASITLDLPLHAHWVLRKRLYSTKFDPCAKKSFKASVSSLFRWSVTCCHYLRNPSNVEGSPRIPIRTFLYFVKDLAGTVTKSHAKKVFSSSSICLMGAE